MKSNEIIVACLTLSAHDGTILRAAQKLAREQNLSWYALYIETPADRKESNLPARNRILAQLAAVERMGGYITHIQAANFKTGLKEFFDEKQKEFVIRSVIAGETSRSFSNRFVSTSQVVNKFCHGNCEAVILSLPQEDKPLWIERYYSNDISFVTIIYSLIAVLLAALITEMVDSMLPPEASGISIANRFLIFLIACVVVAGRFGLLPGLITSVTSFIVIDYFYISPYNDLRIENLSDALSLALFLFTSVIACVFNSHAHAETEKLETSEHRMLALLQIYKIVSHESSQSTVLKELHARLQAFLNAETAFFLATLLQPDKLEDSWPQSPPLNERDRELLQNCWQSIRQGSYVSTFNRDSGWRFEPLITANSELGVLGIRIPTSEAKDGNFNDYMRMVAELVASLLEKIENVHMTEESRVRTERERLRTNLLSSVSHDLKTPLASIIGSLSVYRSMRDRLTESQLQELTQTALEEAQRLDSFITNILELAKIESGAINFKQEWQNPFDMVLRVKKRLRQKLKNRQLTPTLPVTPLEVSMDTLMSEQALMNILDNAIKYTAPDQEIEIYSDASEQGFFLHIRDHGQGIPEGEAERIFDKYTRLQRQDTQVAGTGLGLALARGVMEGQGGRVTVDNHPDGGAVFTLFWPKWRMITATTEAAAAPVTDVAI